MGPFEIVYDTGALLAAERDDLRFRALHRRLLAKGIRPTVPVTALAQAWRDGSKQARLAHLLKGCHTEDLDRATAQAAGELCGRSATSDVVDASVVALAMRRQAAIVTSDRGDLSRLADAGGWAPVLHDV